MDGKIDSVFDINERFREIGFIEGNWWHPSI